MFWSTILIYCFYLLFLSLVSIYHEPKMAKNQLLSTINRLLITPLPPKVSHSEMGAHWPNGRPLCQLLKTPEFPKWLFITFMIWSFHSSINFKWFCHQFNLDIHNNEWLSWSYILKHNYFCISLFIKSSVSEKYFLFSGTELWLPSWQVCN